MKTISYASQVPAVFVAAAVALLSGCPSTDRDEISGSEVAVSVVGGALNNTESQAALGLGGLPRKRRSVGAAIWDQLNPVGVAHAATWTCSGGSLDPAYSGPAGNPYSYTPVSCSVTLRNGKSASAIWNGAFTLSYGATCDARSPFMDNQAAGCALTRTTSTEGATRTLTGFKGNDKAITHNTFGAGTGWDSSVTPAPTNDGVSLTCSTSGCAAGKTLTISGSNLHGTVDSVRMWDHTISTGADGITVTGSGTGRVVMGTVYVQHNLARVTSATTFNNVAFADGACCYPTSGSVTTTFSKGPDRSKTETLTFNATCGEVTLTKPNGTTVDLTLDQCL